MQTATFGAFLKFLGKPESIQGAAARTWVIPWNPTLMVSLAFFWVYGYFAAIAVPNIMARHAITLLLSAMFVGINELAKRKAGDARTATLRPNDLRVFICCLGFAVLAGWSELHEPLANDQLYHLLKVFAHPMRILDRDILQPHSPAAQALDHIPYKNLLYPLNLACLAVAGLLFQWCYAIKRPWLRWITGFTVFAVLRTLIGSYVIAGDIHPLLRLWPLNMSSLLFGITPFAFRLPGLMGLAALQVVLFRKGQALFGSLVTLLAVLALGTCPLVWHLASMPESSIWSALTFTAVVWWCDRAKDEGGDRDYSSIYALIAITVVMRQTACMALVPVGCLQIYGWIRHKQLPHLRTLVEQWAPGLLMIPWTLNIAAYGSPATDHSGTPLTAKLATALGDGRAFTYIYYHLGIIWFICMVVGLLPLRRRNWTGGVLFLMCLCLFYGIVPHLWGVPRYQVEIAYPAATLGFASLLYAFRGLTFAKSQRLYTYVSTVFLVALIAANTYAYKQIHHVDGPIDETTYLDRVRNGSIRGLSENVYDFDRALRDIAAQGLDHGLYVDGTVYGVMPQILAGWTLGAVRSSEELPPVWQGADPRAIEQTASCQGALFADWGHVKTQASVAYLQNHGWQLKGQYTHPTLTGNTLYFLSRFAEKVSP